MLTRYACEKKIEKSGPVTLGGRWHLKESGSGCCAKPGHIEKRKPAVLAPGDAPGSHCQAEYPVHSSAWGPKYPENHDFTADDRIGTTGATAISTTFRTSLFQSATNRST
ncbi:MAG: hypothetical protein U1F87_16000 [Kiritimatiellia bacterium]